MADHPHESILELNLVHHQLEEMFHQHQVALLKNSYSESESLLWKFEAALFHHMREEDDILLPLYRQRAAAVRGGDPEIFTGEHKKITEWLGRLKLRLNRLSVSHSDLKDVVALLDDEAYFKKYMEHHTLRENRIFYPEIERVITEKEKTHILRLLTFSLEEVPTLG